MQMLPQTNALLASPYAARSEYRSETYESFAVGAKDGTRLHLTPRN